MFAPLILLGLLSVAAPQGAPAARASPGEQVRGNCTMPGSQGPSRTDCGGTQTRVLRDFEPAAAGRSRANVEGVAGAQRVMLRPAPGQPASFLSAVLEVEPFQTLLLSWNVDVPDGTGFLVEARVEEHEGEWSPWLFFGDWGELPALERTTSFEGGKVEVDILRSRRYFKRVQWRIVAHSTHKREPVTLRLFALCTSDTEAMRLARSSLPRPAPLALEVPVRSQRDEPAEIAARICSPTAVAMLLAYRGVDVPTGAVAARAFDEAHDIYGNWPRNVQAAWSFGVPGYLTRFSCWTDVERALRESGPLIVSIGVKEGELTGAPYTATAGHLIVLTGLDGNGNCLVNDPAADLATVRRSYSLAELEQVWIHRGGVAYVLLPR